MPEYINRELSWLDFNYRVLAEAADQSIPLLERLKFLSITASNLDEFFMVRVGGLLTAARRGSEQIDPAGMTVSQQLDEIGAVTHRMTDNLYRCFLEDLEPRLNEAGIQRVEPDRLTDAQARFVETFVADQLQSVLTPMAVDTRQFPLLIGATINVCVELAPADEESEPRFAVIPFGRARGRFITLPAEGGFRYILAEDAVGLFVQKFFPGEAVVDSAVFRITRNADMSVNEDDAADFVREIEDVLSERRESFCVRLEISRDTGNSIRTFLQTALAMTDTGTYVCDGPLDLSVFAGLTEISGFDELRYPDWPSCYCPEIDRSRSLLDQIAEQDLLLHHPYESYKSVVSLVEDAADDPDVVAIKQTLYRTSRDSPIVNALIRACENGKHVTVLVELKARFDERRNIEWARRLEHSGVQVVYGVRGLKTHAKICTVVRREPQGYQRYVHLATGNYNEITARFYTDTSYFTANEEFGDDAVAWFNAVCGYSQPQGLRKLTIAPVGMRQKLLEMIHVETNRAGQGQEARILAKLNSLVDPQIIAALYEASKSGVRIGLNVRGICCLRPGVPGLSENIRVVSIIDRYLEHSRLMYFHHGGDDRVFLSSADWMPRNLDRRIELLVPIEDEHSRRKVIEILEVCMSDNVKGRQLSADGTWDFVPRYGNPPVRAQSEFHERTRRLAHDADNARRTTFIPYQQPK